MRLKNPQPIIDELFTLFLEVHPKNSTHLPLFNDFSGTNRTQLTTCLTPLEVNTLDLNLILDFGWSLGSWVMTKTNMNINYFCLAELLPFDVKRPSPTILLLHWKKWAKPPESWLESSCLHNKIADILCHQSLQFGAYSNDEGAMIQ